MGKSTYILYQYVRGAFPMMPKTDRRFRLLSAWRMSPQMRRTV